MGRVKNKVVKRAARKIIEKYYQKLTDDFHLNKKIIENIADIPTKRIRNKIAGFTTHLLRRIEKGPVRGISLKIQEEERERRFDVIPEKSNIQIEETFETNDTVLTMLKEQGLSSLVSSGRVKKKTVGMMA